MRVPFLAALAGCQWRVASHGEGVLPVEIGAGGHQDMAAGEITGSDDAFRVAQCRLRLLRPVGASLVLSSVTHPIPASSLRFFFSFFLLSSILTCC